MRVSTIIITVVVFLLAAAASYIIGMILQSFIGDYGLYAGVIIFLFACRQILIWHRIKTLLIIPDFLLAVLFAWITGTSLYPYVRNWGIFAAVIVFLTGLAMIAHMRAWEVKM